MKTHYNDIVSITVLNKTISEEAKRWITQYNLVLFISDHTHTLFPIFLKKKEKVMSGKLNKAETARIPSSSYPCSGERREKKKW